MGTVGVYGFWRWVKTPNWRWTLLAGLCLGLMLLTKMTWLIAFPLYLLLWMAWLITRRKHKQTKENVPVKSQVIRLGIVFVFAIYLVNLGYCFQGSFITCRFQRDTCTKYSKEVPYKEVAEALTRKAVVHAGETGFHTNGELRWV